MLYNFTRKYDFIPNLKYNSKDLEVVYSHKLLGIICTSDGKWKDNTFNLIKRANTRMFFIRRLKKLGASNTTLKEAYVLFVRPILEMCAPLWTGALMQNNAKHLSESLERIQRNFCRILFPSKTYDFAKNALGLQSLTERRVILSKHCASKMAKNNKFSHLFKTQIQQKLEVKIFTLNQNGKLIAMEIQPFLFSLD